MLVWGERMPTHVSEPRRGDTSSDSKPRYLSLSRSCGTVTSPLTFAVAGNVPRCIQHPHRDHNGIIPPSIDIESLTGYNCIVTNSIPIDIESLTGYILYHDVFHSIDIESLTGYILYHDVFHSIDIESLRDIISPSGE